MTEKAQAYVRQSRQAVIARCCLNLYTIHNTILKRIFQGQRDKIKEILKHNPVRNE